MNPFENESYTFYALRNDEGQHSLWPTFAAVPAGWHVAAEGTRAEVVEYVSTTWTDMRPLSLVRATELDAAARRAEVEQLATAV